MKPCEDIRTTTYQTELDGVIILIDIVEDMELETLEAYAWLEGCGDKHFIIGVSARDLMKEDFLALIERELPAYMEDLDE